MKNKIFGLLVLAIFWFASLHAQRLKAGFDKAEYAEMLRIAQRTAFDTANWKTISTVDEPKNSSLIYRSPVIGLGNRWDLWYKDSSVAVISVRGTTLEAVSWLVNFYSAMISAKGELQLSKTNLFKYDLAANPKAAVHAGFLTAMSFLSKDILPHIDSCYRSGIKDFIITGHSQGGAISYLLNSYLHNLQKKGSLPADIQFKTYCGASPKPGNLYYAYDYEVMTQNGWAFNVINTADWVPEAGISIQTFKDFNTTNPFVNASTAIRKQKFPNNLVGKYIYNRLDNITLRAQKRYQRNLGNLTSKVVKKFLPDFQPPKYYNSNNYVRTGATIVLSADEDYYKLYPDDKNKIFMHHFPAPYLYLLNKLSVPSN